MSLCQEKEKYSQLLMIETYNFNLKTIIIYQIST